MMNKIILGHSKIVGAPKDWNKETDGHCGKLTIRIVDGDVYQSLWEPSPSELKSLNEGKYILLSVKGGQPPVMLSVE